MPRPFEDLAKAQLMKAIRKTFPDPTPLIGEAWFQYHADGDPAEMVFSGVKKLAKATGISDEKVARLLLRHLAADKIGAEVRLTGTLRIHLNRKGKGARAPQAAASAAGKESPGK